MMVFAWTNKVTGEVTYTTHFQMKIIRLEQTKVKFVDCISCGFIVGQLR